MPKSINIKKIEYEKERLSTLIDTSITELVPDTKVFIKDIHDFFKYYEKVKADIAKYEVEESHQNLLFNAVDLTEGNIIVYPLHSDVEKSGGLTYTWNEIEDMASEINNLENKVTELQLTNAGLISNVGALEESINATTAAISGGEMGVGGGAMGVGGGAMVQGEINTNTTLINFEEIVSSTPTKTLVIYNEGMALEDILIEENSLFSAVPYYRDEDAGYIDIDITIKSDASVGIHNETLEISYPEVDTKKITIVANIGRLYDFGSEDNSWADFSHSHSDMRDSKIKIRQHKKNKRGSVYKNNILENGKKYKVTLKYARRSSKKNWRGYMWIGGDQASERITLPKGGYKAVQTKTFISSATGNNWDRLYLRVQNKKNNGTNVSGYFYWVKIWEIE
jgi:hypothetical protein